MSERAKPEALDVLSRAVCEGQSVRLPDEILERDVYEAVAEVLARLGGKWKRRGKAKDGIPQGAHLFPYDPAPLLAAVLETGEMPPKNPTAFFPTPPDVVARMVELCDLACFNHEGLRILEPSAGTGAILDAIHEHAPLAQVDAVEVLPINAAMLRRKGHTVHEGDFMEWRPDYLYDCVLMNPPFSLDGDPLAYITHALHAWDLLKDGGQLVCVTPNGWTFRGDQKCRDFIATVGEYGDSVEVEAGAFKESGTTIATRLVWMRKDDQRWKANPYSGWPTWHCWVTELWSDSEREFHDARARIFREIQSGALALDLFGAPEPAARAAIVEHYRAVVQHANKSFEGIRPTDDDYAHLVEHFMEEYRLWLEWETENPTERREAA